MVVYCLISLEDEARTEQAGVTCRSCDSHGQHEMLAVSVEL
jgi:hypothetical protein